MTFDANGNLTVDQNGQQYVYDAWNRLVTVKNSGGSTIASYKYDALSHRIQQTVSAVTTDFYFSAGWQVLEERVGGTAKIQYVWSPVYVDALVERDRDADGNAGNGLEERFYVQQDANFNVTAIISSSGVVTERYVYDPYGAPTWLSAGWIGPADGYAWRILHQGGKFESVTGLYNFGYRDTSPTLGRWLQVDPLKFAAGDTNLYRYEGNSPSNTLDPSGLLEFFVRRDENGIEHLYVVREFLWFDRTSTERWVGVVLPDGRVERNGRTATRGSVEIQGYEDWDAWFEENGSEINPAPVGLPNDNRPEQLQLDPNFEQRGAQAAGLVRGMILTGAISGLSPAAGRVLCGLGNAALRHVLARWAPAVRLTGQSLVRASPGGHVFGGHAHQWFGLASANQFRPTAAQVREFIEMIEHVSRSRHIFSHTLSSSFALSKAGRRTRIAAVSRR